MIVWIQGVRCRTRRADWLFLFAVVVAFAAVVARRWQQIGPIVSGIDGGSWLAYGRGLFGGPGRSTAGAYPPLVPALLHVCQGLFGANLALKLVDFGSLAAVFAAVCFVASLGVNRWLALVAGVVVCSSVAVIEPTGFGGYPQNLTLALMLIAALGIASYLATFRRRWFVVGAAALVGVALCHHAYYVIAGLVVALEWLIWACGRPCRARLLRGTLTVVLAGILSFAAFLPTLIPLVRAGYVAPLDSGGSNVRDALSYGLHPAVWLWLPVVAVGVAYALLELRPNGPPVQIVSAALLAAAVILLVPAGDTRLLPLLIIGAVLSCGLALEALCIALRRGSLRRLHAAPLLLAALCAIALYPSADHEAAKEYAFYRVNDVHLERTASWLRQQDPAELTAVCTEAERGWPLGWLFEGLTPNPIATGSDLQWLAFPEERARSIEVAQICFDGRDPAAAREDALRFGMRFLIVRTTDAARWSGWTDLRAGQPPLAFHDGEFLVFDLSRG